MSLQIYILGSLTDGDHHPYDIKKKIARSIEDTVKINDGTLYYNFEALLKKGLIRKVEVVQSDNRPEKTMYAITDEGRKTLEESIYDSFRKMTDIRSLYASLLFLDKVDQKKLIFLIEEIIERLDKRLQMFGRNIDWDGVSETQQKGARLISDHAFRMISNDKEWLDKLLTSLKQSYEGL